MAKCKTLKKVMVVKPIGTKKKDLELLYKIAFKGLINMVIDKGVNEAEVELKNFKSVSK